MAGFGYNPSREIELGAERERYEAIVAAVEEERQRVREEWQAKKADDDVDDGNIADQPPGPDYELIDGLPAAPRASPESLLEGVEWCVEQFGPEATITIEGMDSATRVIVSDKLEQNVVGGAGTQMRQLFTVAAGVTSAPWYDTDYDGGADLMQRKAIMGEAPPQVVDWLATEMDRLQALGPGN